MAVRREGAVRAQEAREGPRRERGGVPTDLVLGACPSGVAGGREDGFEERTIEARVVRDDQVRCGEEFGGGVDIDRLAGEVLVGEARDVRDLGRDRPARVLAPGAGLVAVDVRDVAVDRVVEGQHRELDQRVELGAEAGRLAVDEKSAAERARAGRVGMVLEDEGVESADLRRVDASARGGGAGHDGVPLPAWGQITGTVAHSVSFLDREARGSSGVSGSLQRRWWIDGRYACPPAASRIAVSDRSRSRARARDDDEAVLGRAVRWRAAHV